MKTDSLWGWTGKLAIGLIWAWGGMAAGQEPTPAPPEGAGTDSNPEMRSSGSTRLTVNAESIVADNFFYEADDGQSVAGVRLRPELTYDRGGVRTDFNLRLRSETAAFSYGSADNYVDYRGSMNLTYSMSARQRLGLGLSYIHDHDPFGTERTEGSTIADRKLDEWNEPNARLSYLLGTSGPLRLGLESRLAWKQREYTTNESFTRFLEFEQLTGDLTVVFAATPKVKLLAQYIRHDTEYDERDPSGAYFDRSGITETVFVGGRWFASAKTFGDVRVGQSRRKFDELPGQELKEPTWSVKLTWNPSNLTEFALSSGRGYGESYRARTSAIDASWVQLSWRRSWNQRLSTTTSVGYRNNDFSDSVDSDDYLLATIRTNFRIDTGLTLFSQLRRHTRDSNRPNLEFERNEVVIGMSAEFI